MTPTGQASASRTPSAVATPLPPRKREPDREHMPEDRPRRTRPAPPPFPTPRRSAPPRRPCRHRRPGSAAASALLPVRRTLVAPILPEPIWRMSPMPGQPRQQQPERDRAEQIGDERGGNDVHDHRDCFVAALLAMTVAGTIVVRLRGGRRRISSSVANPLTPAARRSCGRRRWLLDGPAPAAVERGVLRFRAERVGVDPPRRVGIEHDQIGRAAGAEPPGVEPENAGRAATSAAAKPRSGSYGGCGRVRATAAAASPADNAAGRRAERQALRILVPRRVIAGDRVDRAVAQALDDGAPVALAAQRRRQLGEGPVVADRGLVQREIGRGGAQVTGSPAAFALRIASIAASVETCAT